VYSVGAIPHEISRHEVEIPSPGTHLYSSTFKWGAPAFSVGLRKKRPANVRVHAALLLTGLVRGGDRIYPEMLARAADTGPSNKHNAQGCTSFWKC